MLRATAAESKAESTQFLDQTQEQGDSRAHRLSIVGSAGSAARRATQQQRRGVGTWAFLFGIVVDAVAVGGVALLLDALTAGDLPIRGLAALYTLIAVVMLLPTHRAGRVVPRPSELVTTVTARLGLAPVLTVVLTWWLDVVDKYVWLQLVVLTVPAVLLGRLLTFKLTHAIRSQGYDLEDVLIVGAGNVGRDLAEAIEQNPDCGLLPIGFVDRFDERGRLPIVGRPEELPTIVSELSVRHVILGYGAATEHEVVRYVRECQTMPVQFYTVPRFFELGVSSGDAGFEVDGFAVNRLGRPGRNHLMWPLKRAFDLCVSSVLFLITLPLFAAVALAVKLTSPGPIFFRQERVSVDNVPFEILKFRTMKYVADPAKQAELDQRAQAVNLDDDRITPIGKFLRKSHLDELPQLLNVLKGEMSIVGPRPERPYFVDQHTSQIEAYAYRHRVPAGITGWAQVHGFWGDSSLETRVRLDNRYIDNWSPLRDLVIGLRTIPTLLGKRR